MSASLNLYSLTVAYGDATQNNNPSLRYVDWKRSLSGIAVANPKSESLSIAPGVEATVWDGTRATSIDGTTAFSLALSPLAPDRYRFTFTGGTNPGFRADRGLNLSGVVLTLTAQANGSLLVAAGAGTPFSALQVGDEVFVRGTTTGDAAGPFNVLNEGRWSVLSVGGSGANVTLVRPAGQDFSGASESVTPSAAGDFAGYASTGVQPGDKMDVSAGFATTAQRTYTVVAVTSTWVEVESSTPLAAQTGITPGASGMKFYQFSKRFVRIEADQDCAVRLNGDTGQTVRMEPWLAADPDQVAEFTKTGPTWTLKILNRSSQTLHLNVVSAE